MNDPDFGWQTECVHDKTMFQQDSWSQGLPLLVDIAQRLASQSIGQISDTRSFNVQIVRLNKILQTSVATGWIVVQRYCPGDCVRLLPVQSLPHPVDPVQHCVLLCVSGAACR